MIPPTRNSSYSIRYATREDAELIADISRQTFFETFHTYNTTANMDKFLREQFTRGRLMLEVGAPANTFVLAYLGNEVAGYLKVRDGKPPPFIRETATLEIARLYAVTSMIGKGVGNLLMQTAIDIAVELDKKIVWLGVWEKNERAISFYHRWGFEKFGEHDFLLGDEVQRDWLMKKEIY